MHLNPFRSSSFLYWCHFKKISSSDSKGTSISYQYILPWTYSLHRIIPLLHLHGFLFHLKKFFIFLLPLFWGSYSWIPTNSFRLLSFHPCLKDGIRLYLNAHILWANNNMTAIVWGQWLIFHRFHFNLWSSDIYFHVTFLESKLQTGYITDLAFEMEWERNPQSGSLHNIIVSLQLGEPTSFRPHFCHLSISI